MTPAEKRGQRFTELHDKAKTGCLESAQALLDGGWYAPECDTAESLAERLVAVEKARVA